MLFAGPEDVDAITTRTKPTAPRWSIWHNKADTNLLERTPTFADLVSSSTTTPNTKTLCVNLQTTRGAWILLPYKPDPSCKFNDLPGGFDDTTCVNLPP